MHHQRLVAFAFRLVTFARPYFLLVSPSVVREGNSVTKKHKAMTELSPAAVPSGSFAAVEDDDDGDGGDDDNDDSDQPEESSDEVLEEGLGNAFAESLGLEVSRQAATDTCSLSGEVCRRSTYHEGTSMFVLSHVIQV